LILEDELKVEVIARRGEFFHLRFENDVLQTLDRYGQVPLPPYITRRAEEFDESRYQTVYARAPGAVAAPTAGLHFDQPMLDKLRNAGVTLAYLTLHVGAGTFQPVRVSDLSEHRMHSERFFIPEATANAINRARASGGRVIAVGTTTLRALEAVAQDGELKAGEGETALFITPDHRFRVVDSLLSNFHLPRSTLLILVSAFGGIENIRRAYCHAIEQRYRFYSYGDAMLIERRSSPN
jgi:S-adenosylmethionine:tRNA ribosyltransferase-isomerase